MFPPEVMISIRGSKRTLIFLAQAVETIVRHRRPKEKMGAFYWARPDQKRPNGLMKMVSSNINQWTILVAMLPVVFGLSYGRMAPIQFDAYPKNEILLTLAQSLLGMMLLANMRVRWYEALALFCSLGGAVPIFRYARENHSNVPDLGCGGVIEMGATKV